METLLARNEICIAVKERLAKDSGEADERAYDTIVARLLTRPRARGTTPTTPTGYTNQPSQSPMLIESRMQE